MDLKPAFNNPIFQYWVTIYVEIVDIPNPTLKHIRIKVGLNSPLWLE
jgi:hypothetical protein